MRRFELDDVSEINRNVVIVNEIPVYTLDYIRELQQQLSDLREKLASAEARLSC